MDKINQAISTLSKELNEHKEKFAAAFLKETGLDPTQVVMLQRNVGNYLDVDIWFRRKTEKEIELERRSETTAAMLRYCPECPCEACKAHQSRSSVDIKEKENGHTRRRD